jgi:hypothetical protein
MNDDFRVGEYVYVISREFSDLSYGRHQFPEELLGSSVCIRDFRNSRWGGDRTAVIMFNSKRIFVNVRDLSYDNTYVAPWPTGTPEYMEQIKDLDLQFNGSYRCDWVMYSDDKDAEWLNEPYSKLYGLLEGHYGGRRNPCRDCWDIRRCHRRGKCKEREMYLKHKDDRVRIVGANNTNTACWAAVMRIWGQVLSSFKKHPTWLLAKFAHSDIKYPKTSKSGMSKEAAVKYLKYMKKGACLPRYLKLPTVEDFSDDVYFRFNLDRVSKERLFWYLCTVRNIAEKPGLCVLTNHFIEKGKMEPLMAFVMAHVCAPGFTGGHSAVFDAPDFRHPRSNYQVAIPIMSKVLPFVVQCHKFLTRKTLPYVTESESFSRWNLSHQTKHTVTRFEVDGQPTIETASKFDLKTRTVKE